MRDFLGAAKEIGLKGEQLLTDAYFQRLFRNKDKHLTKEEKAVLKALDTLMVVDFDKTPLKNVLDYLTEKTKAPILVDENSLQEAKEEYREEITFKLKQKVTVRTVLRKILRERGLSYIIKDGNIVVMTVKQAREILVTRTYPVSDLVAADARLGPFFGKIAMFQSAQFLISLIQNNIEPDIWQNNDPKGPAIIFEPQRMALVVRAPAELHLMMGFGGSRR